MRSLNDISAELSDYPKEMLVQMAQGGNSGYPEISILMEIQARTAEERAVANEQAMMNDPQQTVYEEAVNQFAQSGLSQAQPMMDQQMMMDQQAMMGEEMMPQGGIQMMASGGRVGYQEGRQVQYSGSNYNLLKSFGITDEELKGRAYNIDGINNMGRSDVTQLAEEIVTDRVRAMDKLFYPTQLRRGKEVPESVDPSSMGYDPFGTLAENLYRESYQDRDEKFPTLFPSDDVASTAAFRQNRGGIRGYFQEGGAKTSTDIFNFIASNPQAYEIYSNAGGNANPIAGLEAVRSAGLLGPEADASQFNIANQQNRILQSLIDAQEAENAATTSTSGTSTSGTTNTSGLSQVNQGDQTPANTTEEVLTLRDQLAKDYELRGGDYEVPTFDDRMTTNRTRVERNIMDSLNLSLADGSEVAGLRARLDSLEKPEFELPTEKERQRELSGMGLALLGKAIGGSKNLGEAAAVIGEGVPEIGKVKKAQRDESNAVAQINRSMEIEEFKLSAEIEQLDNQTRNQDNNTRIAAQGLVEQSLQRNMQYNMHADKMTKDWASVDLAHKELFLRAEKNNVDAASAIIKLDLLKAQIADSQNQQLNKTYELLLDQLKQTTENLLGEEAEAEISKISGQIDYVLSQLLPSSVERLAPDTLSNLIENK